MNRIRQLEAEVKNLRNLVGTLASKSDLIALNNRLVDQVTNLVVELVSDSGVDSEKHMRRELEDTTRAIRADVEKAEAAAAATIKNSADTLLGFASELGS